MQWVPHVPALPLGANVGTFKIKAFVIQSRVMVILE
jgi:hypothetical protein